MKNKTYNIAFAIVFICAWLLTACDSPFHPVIESDAIEHGYGMIRISAEDENARSTFPSTVFARYVYKFTRMTDGTPNSEPLGGSDTLEPISGVFTLEVGHYKVTVDAFKAVGDTIPAASGESAIFNIAHGDNGTITVRLTLTAVTTAQGTLTYIIKYPSNANIDTITLRKWMGTEAVASYSNVALSYTALVGENGITQTMSLDSGSYLLNIRIANSGEYAGNVEAIHIYPATSTLYEITFTPDGLITTAVYSISLSETGTYTFPGASYGYFTQTARSVTVTNTGNQPTGSLSVNLTGTNASDFTLLQTPISSIPAGGNASFSLRPNNNLTIGTYTAIVTVSGDNGINAQFNTSFTVIPALPTQPRDFLAIPRNKHVTLSWTAPQNNGGSPITGYQVTRDNWVNTETVTGTTYTFTGLTNGTAYTFRVRATNVAGAGAEATATTPATFTSTANIQSYLNPLPTDRQGNLISEDEPIFISVNLNLGNGFWSPLTDTINNCGKYVGLDLTNSSVTNGNFDPSGGSSYRIMSLILPNAATIFGSPSASSVFRNNLSYLREISGEQVTTIREYVFEDHTRIRSVNFPKVVQIQRMAFYGCTNLTNINFPLVTSIGLAAFSSCNLTSLDFPEATSIGAVAFQECTGITSANFQKAITIGQGAFHGCTSLSSVSLPLAVTIGENNAPQGGVFHNCIALTSLDFPEATSIGQGTFYGCTALGSINAPKVTYISNYALGNTGNKALTINLGFTVPTLGIDMFSTMSTTAKTVTIRIPAGVPGYGASSMSSDNATVICWANGFRGWGWNGSSFMSTPTGFSGANISVIIENTNETVIIFDANNATSGSTPAAQILNVGSTITLPSGSGLTRTGYTFGGWNESADGTGANYTAGSSHTINTYTFLYARWIQNYVVTYNTNGATSGSAPTSSSVSANTVITLPNGSGFSRTGCTFIGWNENSAGTGADHATGSSYTVTGSVTLYAKWSATVAFNINGGTGTAPASQTATMNSVITLPSGSGLTRTGYTFGGWNENSAGTGNNYNANSSYTVTGAVTLYAKWTIINPFTIPGADLAAKLSWLQAEAVSGVAYIIEVNTTENIDPTTLSYSGKSNITLTLRGLTAVRTINLSSNGSMFTVGNSVTLVLDNNITLQGRSGNSGSMVRINSGGTLIMNAGSKITGNDNSSAGGGVSVSFGNFAMTGGEISNNTTSSGGGGVYVSSGTFTMTGGEISNNTASSSGGGVSTISGTFTMAGGEISGNTASSTGGGVSSSGTFTMTGGTISGNTGSNSGGVYADGQFIMKTGARIINNTANGGSGGGIRIGSAISTGTLTMEGGEISGNNSVGGNYTGGGVYVNNGTFTMTGGTINGNSSIANGGGVSIASSCTFTMENGEIKGNNVVGSGFYGGGVYVVGTFTMTGGAISGNSASVGGGVGINTDSGIFRKEGGGIIYGNNEGVNTNNSTATVKSGYAVYWGYRYRNATLGVNDNISTDVTTSPPWGQ